MNPKQLRGQVRQVIKEMWTDVMSTELYQSLTKHNQEQLKIMHTMIKETLERIDQRQKDVQSLIMREFSRPAEPVVKTEEEPKRD